MARKIISPVFYFFSFPLAIFISAVVHSILNPVITDGEITYGYALLPGIDTFYAIVLIMTVFYLLMSALARMIDRVKIPNTKDHFRQSIGLYILLPIILVFLAILQFKLVVVFLAMCLWAIIMNAVYLLSIRIMQKSNLSLTTKL